MASDIFVFICLNHEFLIRIKCQFVLSRLGVQKCCSFKSAELQTLDLTEHHFCASIYHSQSRKSRRVSLNSTSSPGTLKLLLQVSNYSYFLTNTVNHSLNPVYHLSTTVLWILHFLLNCFWLTIIWTKQESKWSVHLYSSLAGISVPLCPSG